MLNHALASLSCLSKLTRLDTVLNPFGGQPIPLINMSFLQHLTGLRSLGFTKCTGVRSLVDEDRLMQSVYCMPALTELRLGGDAQISPC